MITDKTLRDDNHIARYCRPRTLDEHKMPAVTAFRPRPNENYLSVNWLECFRTPDLVAAVDRVREVFRNKNYEVKPGGRFAVLNVRVTKTTIFNAVKLMPRIEHMPSHDDASHAGIIIDTADEYTVAKALVEQVKRDPQNVHYGITHNRDQPLV